MNGCIDGECGNEALPVRVVEGYGVNHVPVPVQGVQLLSRRRVPEFAGAVIAPSDEANAGTEISHQVRIAVS